MEDILIAKTLKHLDFEHHAQEQKHGIDMILMNKKPKIDIKTRQYQYHKFGDILLETISVIEKNKEGWLYYTDADLICYVWENESRNNLIDGYWLIIQPLKEWFKGKENKYPKKIAESIREDLIWHTENRAVPIKDIPKEYIYRFNPRLNNAEQLTLAEFQSNNNVDDSDSDLSKFMLISPRF